jgi:hypothetical protein
MLKPVFASYQKSAYNRRMGAPFLPRFRRVAFSTLPALVAVNFAMLALSFTRWYEGGPHEIGVADHLFGWARVFGWRGDVVWLFASTLFAFVTLLVAIPQIKADHSARRSALLAFCWIIGAVFYVWHILTSGLIYMG